MDVLHHGNANDSRGIFIKGFKSLDEIANESKYDFVLASAILEHLKNPRADMERLFEAMKPEGLFYARTPYMFPFKSCYSRSESILQ